MRTKWVEGDFGESWFFRNIQTLNSTGALVVCNGLGCPLQLPFLLWSLYSYVVLSCNLSWNKLEKLIGCLHCVSISVEHWEGHVKDKKRHINKSHSENIKNVRRQNLSLVGQERVRYPRLRRDEGREGKNWRVGRKIESIAGAGWRTRNLLRIRAKLEPDNL